YTVANNVGPPPSSASLVPRTSSLPVILANRSRQAGFTHAERSFGNALRCASGTSRVPSGRTRLVSAMAIDNRSSNTAAAPAFTGQLRSTGSTNSPPAPSARAVHAPSTRTATPTNSDGNRAAHPLPHESPIPNRSHNNRLRLRALRARLLNAKNAF